MRFRAIALPLFLTLVLCFLATAAHAQGSTAALKGNWDFTITTVTTGPIPAAVSFKTNGRGTIDLGPDSLPMVYRESTSSSDFSMTFEVTREASPTGSAFTALIRGHKTSDNDLSGVFFVIQDTGGPTGASLIVAGRGAGPQGGDQKGGGALDDCGRRACG